MLFVKHIDAKLIKITPFIFSFSLFYIWKCACVCLLRMYFVL